MSRRIAVAGLSLLALLGCELDAVEVVPGEDILVVEGVLRPDKSRQFVLLHRGVAGRAVPGESGARVVLTRVDDGAELELREERSIQLCAVDKAIFKEETITPTCYSNSTVGFVQPGATYDLDVETVAGERVQGRTTVPSDYGYTSPRVRLNPTGYDAYCTLPSDPFTLIWTRSEGAWAYVINMRIYGWNESLPEIPFPIELTSVSVSAADTTLIFPSNIGLFQRGDLDNRIFETLKGGLPPNLPTELVVLATDRNYTNAIRGGRFNPSGNVRITSVVGDGIGVFGSALPITIRSPGNDTVAECPAPRPPLPQ